MRYEYAIRSRFVNTSGTIVNSYTLVMNLTSQKRVNDYLRRDLSMFSNYPRKRMKYRHLILLNTKWLSIDAYQTQQVVARINEYDNTGYIGFTEYTVMANVIYTDNAINWDRATSKGRKRETIIIGSHKFVTGKMYPVTYSPTIPSSYGQDRILSTIRNEIRTIKRLSIFDRIYEYMPEDFTEEIGWEKNPPNQPRFSKRIKAWFFKNKGIQFSDQFLEKIGNMHAEYLPAAFHGFVKFTSKVNWQSGTFGDHGSCYFTDYQKHTRYDILMNNGYAIQVFNVNKEPIGRSWLIHESSFMYPSDHMSWYYFNVYGLDHSVFHAIMRTLTGYEPQSTGFYVDGFKQWFINGETGYVLSDRKFYSSDKIKRSVTPYDQF